MQLTRGARFRKLTAGWWNWLPLIPFLVITIGVMVLPLAFMLEGSFQSKEGFFTFDNYLQMTAPVYTQSFRNSILLSGITAILGTILGTAVGYFVHQLRSSRVRELVVTLCDVTSNFSGAPLAFAFIVILGSNGVLTLALSHYFGWKIYPTFSIYSFWGLVLAYTYFQLPLMVLLVLPAVAGLKQEWREAALSLGADARSYWRYIGPGQPAPAFCQRFWSLCHRVHTNRFTLQPGDAPTRLTPDRRGAA